MRLLDKPENTRAQWNRGCNSREVPDLCLMYFFDKAGAEDVIEQLRPITCEVMPQSLLATRYREKIAIKLLIPTPVELHLRESLIVGNAVAVALAFGDRPIEVEQKGAQLASGTLSEARFKHYITQDAHYLIGFGRALTLAAAKAPNPDRIVQFAKAAEGALVVERALHGSFFKQYGITPRAFAQTPLSPACHHYVSYLLATAYGESYEVLLGALLPCFWVYAEVGRDIHARARAANPYQAWIDTYAGEEFHAAVRAVIAATDEAAADVSPSLRTRMHAAFTRATQLEWVFWDSAFRLETWPV